MIKRLFTIVALMCATIVSLTAQNVYPSWHKNSDFHFTKKKLTTQSNFTMMVIGTIDGERCDSAFEIGVFCGDECREVKAFYANKKKPAIGHFSSLVVNGVEGESFGFRIYDHRNNVEVEAAGLPQNISFIADAEYGSFNTSLYELAFNNSTTHRAALAIDDATDLPYAGKQYGITADGIACSYTRDAYLDGGYETIVLPFDADITEIKAQGFVFEKFEGFGDNTIKFIELEEGENLQAGVAYLFRYSGTPSDGREKLLFEATVQQVSDEIVSQEGWAGTFKAMGGSKVAGKYILNIKGDKMQKAGNTASLAPYHACLTLPENVNTAMLKVSHGRGTTGINNLQQQSCDDAEVIYDLNGRIIKDLPNSGIIIKNKKKIYIK